MKISQHWRRLSITTKFSLAFNALLAMILLVAITSCIALITVRRQTEAAILTSAEIQRLVLEMDRGLQEARRLERDFFLRYPKIGFREARGMYVKKADRQIAQVVALSSELKQLVSESDVSDALRKSDVNLNLYFSASSRYAAAFGEAVALVRILADDEIGVQVQLAQNSSLLKKTLEMAGDFGLLLSYHEMQSFEKEYLLTRKRPFMQSAFNTALGLHKAIEDSASYSEFEKIQSLIYLENYQDIAGDMLELDVAIRSKLNEFDLQAEALDPISAKLVSLASKEVERARTRILRTSRLATLILIITALAGLILAGIIAKVLNRSITRNVITLTEAARQFQNKCEVSDEMVNISEACLVQIDSADEIGQLADNFNAMAARISSLVGSLECKVAERTEELSRTLEHLKTTQQELVQSEKMAALGQLVAGIAHEINSPLGAIRSSVENISKTLNHTLNQLPIFFQSLSQERKNDFFALLHRSLQKDTVLSVREERKHKRALIRKLNDHHIKNSSGVANMLVIIGIHKDIDHLFPLFQDRDGRLVLEMAYKLSGLQRSTQIITVATDRASKIVFALKTYTRSDASGDLLMTDIPKGIETVLTLYHNHLKQGVQVTRHYEKGIPMIPGYPDELSQVWTNLIHNALQSMEYKGILTIDVLRQYDMIVVRITDTGKGISDEIKDKIFDPFFTTKPPGEGSGLGLDIVKKVIGKHNGNINVKSEPGIATTFCVYLPISPRRIRHA